MVWAEKMPQKFSGQKYTEGWPVLLVHDGQNKQKAGKLRKNWHAVEACARPTRT